MAISPMFSSRVSIDTKTVSEVKYLIDVMQYGILFVDSHKIPKLQLSNLVEVTDDFRGEMNEWLLEMFGTNPVLDEGTYSIITTGGRPYIAMTEGTYNKYVKHPFE